MNSRVYIAGLGVISAIGNNVAECLHALENEQAGMNNITYLKTIHANEIPVAEVKMDNEQLALKTGLSNKISRTALLSMIAAKEALNDAAIENLSSLRTGFISANTVGGIDKTENFFQSYFKNNAEGNLHDVINHECGSITEIVADKLNINSFTTTIAQPVHLQQTQLCLRQDLLKTECLMLPLPVALMRLTKFTLNGFNTLLILISILQAI